jgi:hypothetical protein
VALPDVCPRRDRLPSPVLGAYGVRLPVDGSRAGCLDPIRSRAATSGTLSPARAGEAEAVWAVIITQQYLAGQLLQPLAKFAAHHPGREGRRGGGPAAVGGQDPTGLGTGRHRGASLAFDDIA